MAEFIITSEQLKTIVDAVSETISRPITEVFVSGDKLPEIVRCHECKCYLPKYKWCYHFEDSDFEPEPDGFCKWGEKKDV